MSCEVSVEMLKFQERARLGERGLLGRVGKFLIYGVGYGLDSSEAELAAYFVAKEALLAPSINGLVPISSSIPRPVLEIAAYVEALPPRTPEELEMKKNIGAGWGAPLYRQLARNLVLGEPGPALVVKSRGGESPYWLKRGTKTHEELAADAE